jgi:hypothetical protein
VAVTQPARSGLDAYVARGLTKIPGFLEQTDVRVLQLVDEAMRAEAVTGDILEVGTYLGRSAIALGFLLDDSRERLVVSDFFDRPRPIRAEFEANYRKYHARLPTIVEGPSQDLDPTELGRGGFRLVHIDGGHEWESIDHDVELARQLLKPDGVVVFDDALSEQFPAVAARVWTGVTSGVIHPVALTWKLYATFEPDTAVAREVRRRLLASSEFDVTPRRVADCEFLQARPSSAGRSPWRRRPSKDMLEDLTPPVAYRAARRMKNRMRGPSRH